MVIRMVQRLFASSAPEFVITQHHCPCRGVSLIRLNRPEKLNAFNGDIWTGLRTALAECASRHDTTITALVGTGRYFTAGADRTTMGSGKAIGSSPLSDLVNEFIKHPKLVVAMLNGPAVGIGVTILGLVDLVYCLPQATLSTPFPQIGLVVEGCSSYTFGRAASHAKAYRMLQTGAVLTAEEGMRLGIISAVDESEEAMMKRCEELAKLPPNAVLTTKRLIRRPLIDALNRSNKREATSIKQQQESTEFMELQKSLAFGSKKKAKL